MIILDTNILWGLTPEDSSADLLRAIRSVAGERVAVPWVVMEELAAQRAIKYQEQHARATAAIDALRETTPWSLGSPLGPCEPNDVRKDCRERWSTVLDVIETSYSAFREAAFREANCLPPCKIHKSEKIGSRDAAIWLSAIEYAKQHPEEQIYFVSNNTRDFGDGTAYPDPMDKDVAGLTNTFRHYRNMDELVAEFATAVPTDETALRTLLEKPKIRSQLVNTATEIGCLPMDGTFNCTIADADGVLMVVPAYGWFTGGRLTVDEVKALQSYRIGDQEWFMATVRWQLTGFVNADRATTWGACRLTTTVLLVPSTSDPRLTILRADWPQPVTAEVFQSIDFPPLEFSEAAEDAMQTMRESLAASIRPDLHPLRGPRAYEGAWARARRAGAVGVPRTPIGE
ncbi:hypothetical protein GCM10027073_74220 [Streptomyces chlorus]|uniref:PIN domain-containing protein n=1 Tax=Streptomyces chlorus TaxID=887452 RepID=A0ABW1EBN2_9ACTN